MQNRELRKEYLLAQALTYITLGLFLISYASAVGAATLFLVFGMILCLFSVVILIVLTLVPRYVSAMESFDDYLKPINTVVTLAAVVLGIFDTKDKGFFEVRLAITVVFSLVLLLSMLVGMFRIISRRVGPVSGIKGFFYSLSVSLALLTLGLGLFWILYGISDPALAKQLLSLNKWMYNPMWNLAITLLCVFPILILTPEDTGDDNHQR